MAHYCVCPKCNEKFNRDKIASVKINGNRYGHATCYPDIKDILPVEVPKPAPAEPDLQDLKDYIAKLYGNKANWALITKQIKDFHTKEKYTYSGMKKALEYFYEVNHNSPDESNGGVGIIAFVYDQAYDYYYKIWLAQQATENKTLITRVKEFIIKPPQQKGTKNKLLDWTEEEDNEE